MKPLLIFEALDHRHAVATTLHDLGLIARFSNLNPLAEARFTRALTTFREMGTQRGAASCLHNLAAIALGYRRWDEGRGLLLEAMEIYSRIGR